MKEAVKLYRNKKEWNPTREIGPLDSSKNQPRESTEKQLDDDDVDDDVDVDDDRRRESEKKSRHADSSSWPGGLNMNR